MTGVKIESQIPVVDLSLADFKPGTDAWNCAREVAMRALEENGCFIVEFGEGGVPSGLHDAVFKVTEEFFNLPHKTKILNTNFKPSHGYIPHVPGTPLLEGSNIDGAEKLNACEKFTHLMWPSGNDGFCETVHSYSKLIVEIEKMVMKMIVESYGVESFYNEYLESSTYLLRFLKYKKPQQDYNPIAHTDKSFLSYLHQDKVRGLEIMTKDGSWFTYEPSPTSFMVMAGDACVAWSNGRIKACYHRVAVREEKIRYSIGTFSYQTGNIEIPKEFIDDAHPRQFKDFNHIDFLCFYDSKTNPIKAESLIKAYCGV
ncbi:hypothetical protein MLD38_007962 [Melastoma candidum]|uniref:Uncharacterized protein n=1 Tax=Melastoma candidum TaxID=119954 RepID=A0ACB9RU20_9MYRT|nr:hypothetical protein MLD38_007962 [Melastoma candidum]